MKVITVLLLALATASAGTLPHLKNVVHPRDRTIGRSIEGRILGGENALLGEVPYQVGIVFDFWFCGGSIIDEWWVITAAHCTYGATEATIYAGFTLLEVGVVRTVTIDNFRQYPGFDTWYLTGDISLIKLDKAWHFSALIDKVGLPPLNGHGETYEGQIATVSGWGLTSDSNTQQPCILQKVETEIISNDVCNIAYGGEIKPEIMCANPSTCYGDSGGPLVIYYETGPEQVGVVSFGSSLGCAAAPSGFTRISFIRHWIFTTSGI